MSEFSRRLPVYLLLDVSGSMQGDPIEAVRHGVRALISELRGDPQALETAYLSVITFNQAQDRSLRSPSLCFLKSPSFPQEELPLWARLSGFLRTASSRR